MVEPSDPSTITRSLTPAGVPPMKRFLLVLAPLVALAGCVIRTGPYVPYQPAPVVAAAPLPPEPAPAPPPVEVYYYGQHFIPEAVGGGWCYLDGPHTHDYSPDRADWYEQDGGYWYYRGPFQFTY